MVCWAGTRVDMLNKRTSGLEIHTLANARCLPNVQCFALIALVHCAPRTRVAAPSKGTGGLVAHTFANARYLASGLVLGGARTP